MAMTKQGFLELEGNVTAIWKAYMDKNKTYTEPLYNMITKKSGQFTDYTIGAPGRMNDWEGSVSYDTFEEGYTKQYRAKKKSTGIQVDRDMWEDDEFERLKPYINNVAYGVTKTLRYDGVKIFNGAFGTEILGPDGKALCAVDHKTTPNAPEQSNLGNNELTYEGLETSMLALEHLVDDRGDEMLIEGNFVIAGPQQRDNLTKLFGSEKEAYVGDNTMNAYEGMKYFIHPLIKGKKWFLANEEIMKGGNGLNWFMRRDPRTLERDMNMDKGDFNTEKLSWKAVSRYDIGFTNFFWVFGNNI